MSDSLPPFDGPSFGDLKDHPKRESLWHYLNEPETKTMMKTASDLGRPALEPLEELLLQRFEVFRIAGPLRDRFKQMCGAMVRQVMEGEGYEWVRDNVPMSGAPFSRASKYRRRGVVEFHVWRNTINPRLICVTPDRGGARIPAPAQGKWSYWKVLEGTLRLAVGAGVRDLKAAQASLAGHGYYVEQTERLLRAAR